MTAATTAPLSTCTALVRRIEVTSVKVDVECLKDDARKAAIEELRANPKVGAYCNEHFYTDVEPFEIVKIVSEKCIEVRAMIAEKDPTWKPDFIPGGFFGHTANNHEQRWFFKSNPAAAVVRIRKHANGQWYRAGSKGTRFIINVTPIKFHDYNF